MKDELKAFTPEHAGRIEETPELKRQRNKLYAKLAQQFSNPGVIKAQEFYQHQLEAEKTPKLSDMAKKMEELERLRGEREERLAEASGRIVTEFFAPKIKDLEDRLETAETKADKAFKRSIIAGTISGILATTVCSGIGYLLNKYVITPTTTPTTTPHSSPKASQNGNVIVDLTEKEQGEPKPAQTSEQTALR